MASILLIDDDVDVRECLGELLAAKGFEVITAEDGSAGLELFSKRTIDLTITDLCMPGKDGFEVIRNLRSLDQGAKIIVLSGAAAELRLELNDALSMGARYAFRKPVNTKELLSAIRALLAQ